MRILGIETSCDETAVAIVEGELGSPTPLTIVASVVASSAELQTKYGGVIPEQAAREQVKAIVPVLNEVLEQLQSSVNSHQSLVKIENIIRYGEGIDAIAITVGPGLVGSLLVGVETARTLAYVWKKPIIPVNHLGAHLYAAFLVNSQQSVVCSQPEIPTFPAIGFVISGGHTDMVLMKDHNRMKWIGGTLDDAAGECFDKCARLLGLPYPGGPAIAAKAEEWLQSPNSKFEIRNSKLTKFPRPMIREDSYDFSFSGLKTAVLREVTKEGSFDKLRTSALSMHEVRALAAEVQEAICDSLVGKLRKAVEHYKPKSVIVAGGVAANKRLKEKLEQEIGNKTSLFIPPPKLCTDNGAYIAAWAFYHYSPIPWQKIDVEPGLGIMGG